MVIRELSSRPDPLKVCILENVIGITFKTSCKRTKDGPTGLPDNTYLDHVLRHLKGYCPDMIWTSHKVLGTDCGVPQRRPRCYIVGTHKEFHLTFGNHPGPVTAPNALPQLPLDDFLDEVGPEMMSTAASLKTPGGLKALNAATYQDQFMKTKPPGVHCGTSDLGRTPTRKFGSFLKYNECNTFTCNNTTIQVHGEVPHKVSGEFGRPLLLRERCRMSGVDYDSLKDDLGDGELLKAVGNMMPPPCVGRLIGQVGLLISQHEHLFCKARFYLSVKFGRPKADIIMSFLTFVPKFLKRSNEPPTIVNNSNKFSTVPEELSSQPSTPPNRPNIPVPGAPTRKKRQSKQVGVGQEPLAKKRNAPSSPTGNKRQTSPVGVGQEPLAKKTNARSSRQSRIRDFFRSDLFPHVPS